MNPELVAECIKNLEPATRARGRSIDFDELNAQLNSGQLNSFLTHDEEQIKAALDRYDARLTEKAQRLYPDINAANPYVPEGSHATGPVDLQQLRHTDLQPDIHRPEPPLPSPRSAGATGLGGAPKGL